MLAAAALRAWTVSGSEIELFSTSGAVGIYLETVSHMAVESILLPFLRISLELLQISCVTALECQLRCRLPSDPALSLMQNILA